MAKYTDMPSQFVFHPIAVNTQGPSTTILESIVEIVTLAR